MNSLIEVIKICKALKVKSSEGRISECVPDYSEFAAKILTVSLPRFSRLFCLLSSRILQNNLLD